MSSLTIDLACIRVKHVVCTDNSFTIELSDGRTISVPIEWYPRLKHGTPDERANWHVIGGGEGIHWLDLDEDISVEHILAGKPSGESQRSLRQWLATRSPSKRDTDAEQPGNFLTTDEHR